MASNPPLPPFPGNAITVASPPTTLDVTQESLATMAALSGVLTDYNIGSQIRTIMESIGSVIEQQGISALALALQTIAYSAMSLFGITPSAALPASGTVTFYTAILNPPPATQNVSIPTGTIVSTVGGIQFSTLSDVVLLSGSTSTTAPIAAVLGGSNGNVPPGSIQQILTGLAYPLTATNLAQTLGGQDQETPAEAQTRLAAAISSLVGGSPVSVANSVIGVVASGTTETVLYSTCYEPWLANQTWFLSGSPSVSGLAGFNVYIDNGGGGASSALVSAAVAQLNGSFGPPTVPAYRPSGVPYNVYPAVPVFANVLVSGSLTPPALLPQISGAITSAVSGYFTLPFGTSAYQASVAAAAANAALGSLTSVAVNLYYASAPTTAVSAVSALPYQRVVLQTLNVNV